MIALQVLLYSDNDYRTIYMSSINRKHTLLCDICLERRQSHSEKSILAHFLHVSTANSGLNIDSHFTMFPVKLCLSLFSLVRRRYFTANRLTKFWFRRLMYVLELAFHNTFIFMRESKFAFTDWLNQKIN